MVKAHWYTNKSKHDCNLSPTRDKDNEIEEETRYATEKNLIKKIIQKELRKQEIVFQQLR